MRIGIASLLISLTFIATPTYAQLTAVDPRINPDLLDDNVINIFDYNAYTRQYPTLPRTLKYAIGYFFGQTSPEDVAFFEITVNGHTTHPETYCLLTTKATAIDSGMSDYLGQQDLIPSGTIMHDSGGFNYGYGGNLGDAYPRLWSWHLDPDSVGFAENTIEVCDGAPHHIEYGILEYPSYCPWNAKVTAPTCRI